MCVAYCIADVHVYRCPCIYICLHVCGANLTKKCGGMCSLSCAKSCFQQLIHVSISSRSRPTCKYISMLMSYYHISVPTE